MENQTEKYTGNLNLNFSGQISYKDYRNTSLEMYFKRRWLMLALILFLIVVLLMLENTGILIVLWLGILLIFPFLIIRSAKKLYQQNKTFHEKLTYHLDDEKITITGGETVNSTQNWNRFYKIQETRNFFLLFHDSIVANWLDKKMFSNEEIIEFRKFVNSLDIKNDLKKN